MVVLVAVVVVGLAVGMIVVESRDRVIGVRKNLVKQKWLVCQQVVIFRLTIYFRCGHLRFEVILRCRIGTDLHTAGANQGYTPTH